MTSNCLSINSDRSSLVSRSFDEPLILASHGRFSWLNSSLAHIEKTEISLQALWIKIVRKVYQFLKPFFSDILSPESSAKKLIAFLEDFFLKDHAQYHQAKGKIYDYLKSVSPVEFALPTKEHIKNKLVKELPFFKNFLKESAQKGLHRDERNYYTYLQFMAQHMAYRRLKVGDRLPMCLDLAHNPHGTRQYVVKAVFKNEYGLVAYGLIPEYGRGRPLFLVQGTDKTNMDQINADLHPNIGSKAVAESRAEIEKWFKRYTKEQRALVAGHSLGGAISQVVMSEFSPYIHQVASFNAPSPGRTVALKWEEQAKLESRFPEKETKSLFHEPIVHFWAKGDTVVECAGHWHLRGKMVRLIPDCEQEDVPKTACKGLPETYANTPHSLPSLMFDAYKMKKPYLYEPGVHEPTLMGEGAMWLRDLLVDFVRQVQEPDPVGEPSAFPSKQAAPQQLLKV